jgi:hypothetical protein
VARYGPSDEQIIADIGLVAEDGFQKLGLGYEPRWDYARCGW